MKMNCNQLIQSWQQKNPMCSCLIISTPEAITLYPDMINEIIIQFEDNPPTTRLQIISHMDQKPWRIISEYIYFNQRTYSLTIPIITSSLHTLCVGEPICHVAAINMVHTLKTIKGNVVIK